MFLVLLMSVFLWSCGESVHKKAVTGEELDLLLQSGRYTERSGLEKSFSLVSEVEFVDVHADAGDGSARWILFNTEMMPDVNVETIIENSFEVIDRYSSYLGVDRSDLFYKKAPLLPLTDRMISVTFQRRHAGLVVRDAYFQVIYSCPQLDACRLREFVNDTYGQIVLANEEAYPESAEIVVGNSYLKNWDRTQGSEDPFIIARDADQNGVLEFYRARQLSYTLPDAQLTYNLVVADGDAVPVEAFSNRFSITYQVTAEVHSRQGYIDNTKIDWPMGIAPIINGNDQFTTNLDGFVEINTLNASPEVKLDTDRLRLVNASNQVEELALIKSAGGSLKVDVSDAVDFRKANAFLQVHRLIRHIKQFVTSDEVAILDQPTVMRTEYTPQNASEPANCNAFFQPGNIGFIALYTAGNGCANIALLPDVIFHEFGHGVDHTSGPASGPGAIGITDGASSEAFGDIISMLMTGSPKLAPGFLLNNPNSLRDLSRPKVFPDDLENQSQVHLNGLILGSTMYDLYVAMRQRHGDSYGAYYTGKLFYRHMLATDNYRDSYQAILRVDDDDGNPGTRSPNHCLINSIFAAHGLATDDNCDDAPQRALIEPNSDLVLAVRENTGAQTSFMASAPIDLAVSGDRVKVMTLCVDELKACLADEAKRQTMKMDGAKGDRLLYSGAPIRPNNLGMVHLILWDVDNAGKPTNALAQRQFLWSEK